ILRIVQHVKHFLHRRAYLERFRDFRHGCIPPNDPVASRESVALFLFGIESLSGAEYIHVSFGECWPLGRQRGSLRKDPQDLLPRLDHHTTELVRLLRGHLAHVRPEELARRPEFAEERGPLGSDRGLEGVETLLDLLTAAPQIRLALAGDSVRLAPFLAAHGEESLAKEGSQSRVDRARARLVEPVIPFLDRLDDLVPVHRAILEQVQDETLEIALAKEVEESAEFLRRAHEDSSFRRNQRIARTPPTIAYARKTRSEVAGSGTNATPSPPPGPGRTAAPPST